MKIDMTPQAIEKVKALILEEGGLPKRLRISVSGGGCAGFQYHFLLDEEKLEDDLLFTFDGIDLVIDESSLDLVKGSVVDYVNDLVGSSFVIKNPNAESSCGCGNSFSI